MLSILIMIVTLSVIGSCLYYRKKETIALLSEVLDEVLWDLEKITNEAKEGIRNLRERRS